MKMNNKMKAVVKIVEGLIFIAIGLSMVGCEEAKEVENLNIQDTKPVVEDGLNLETRVCEFCGETTYKTLDFVNEEIARQKETIAKTTDIDDKLEMTTYLEKFIAFKGCNNCIKADYEKDTKVEEPVKEEPKKEVCPMCLEEDNVDNMVRIGEAYYHQGCYEDPGVAQDYGYKCCLCGIELHNYEQDPDAPADEQYCETCLYEESVKYNCVYCGKTHGIADSYYNEDGMSACSEACFNAYMDVQLEEVNNAKCENCGHDVSDVIDNAGGYWCEACDYVK